MTTEPMHQMGNRIPWRLYQLIKDKKPSMNQWIVEAIEEKLKKEEGK